MFITETMSRPLNVLFVTSEVEPFVKTGGLADVSSALPQTIRELGHEIRIVVPRYGAISDRKFRLHDVIRLKEIEVPIGEEMKIANVNSSFISNARGKVQVYFLANKELFGRQGIYLNPDTQKDYPDNDNRFIFFCRGVLETLKRLGWQPDIIHCNDWQTGLIPAYLKTIYKNDPFCKNLKTVFTIHNLAYQGIFPASSFEKTNLPQKEFSPEGVEFFGKLNFMKAGLMYADVITTVSEKYATEICSSNEFGCGLEGILQKRQAHLHGITNGIDYNIWNPETDELIAKRYDHRSFEGKADSKREIQNRFGLEAKDNTPMIGMITRLVDQKGIDLIKEIADDILKLDVQLVLLAAGEKKYEDFFSTLHKKHHSKVALHLGYDEELAHLIEAGSDMFLMPSRYEPCGLNQLYSLKYGTVPIVRATGGLDDTIRDVEGGNGTGFKFEKYDAKELLKTIQRALKMYHDQPAWKKIVRTGMQQDFSWESSAKKYATLYRNLVKQ
jgi:starch synthase